MQQILFQNRTEKIIILIFCVFPRSKYIDYVTCHVTRVAYCVTSLVKYNFIKLFDYVTFHVTRVMLFITVWVACCSVENLFPNCLCSVTRRSFGTCWSSITGLGKCIFDPSNKNHENFFSYRHNWHHRWRRYIFPWPHWANFYWSTCSGWTSSCRWRGCTAPRYSIACCFRHNHQPRKETLSKEKLNIKVNK